MTFERWLWALEGAARYFELLERTFEREDTDPDTRDSIAKILMEICQAVFAYDLGEIAKDCRKEKDRFEQYARAAAEGGSVGITIRVMLPPSLLWRVAFDAEGATPPDPGTTYFFEAGPKGDRLLVSTPDEDGWREIAHQQGCAGARAGGQCEGGAGEGLADRGDGKDQVPKDPGSVGDR
jgi:hypothetical protein